MAHIKIRIPLTPAPGTRGPTGENLWAKELTPTTAQIDNSPFFTKEYVCGDIVEFDPISRNITKLIKRTARDVLLRFDEAGTRAETLERWRKIYAHFQAKDGVVESGGGGFFIATVPLTMTEADLQALVEACPVPLQAAEEFPASAVQQICSHIPSIPKETH